jgi:predicted transcriptional regulator
MVITEEAVMGVVVEHEPCTVTQVLDAIPGTRFADRGTVRNRLYALERKGLLISDEQRPLRFAINHACSEEE